MSWSYLDAGASVLIFVAWSRALSDAEIKSISDTPWQVFVGYEKPVFVGVGAAPSGLSITAELATATASGQVINRGYNADREQWKEALGRALFTGDSNRGSLKVSFFGPFYGGYHVVALDEVDYRWAMVVGPDVLQGFTSPSGPARRGRGRNRGLAGKSAG